MYISLLREYKQHKIEDNFDARHSAYLIWNQDWIPYFTQVGGNEYQFMYDALTIKFAKNETFVFVSIPLALYTFPQRVTPVSVLYNFEDIARAHNDNLQNTYNKFEELSKILLDLKYDFTNLSEYDSDIILTTLHSVHRHPGAFGFSSTDRSKSIEQPGVIYRNYIAKEKLQHDSIIYLSQGKPHIFITETYIVNVQPERENSNIVTGTYTRIPTFTYFIKESEIDIIMDSSFKKVPDPAFEELCVTIMSLLQTRKYVPHQNCTIKHIHIVGGYDYGKSGNYRFVRKVNR